MAFRLSCLVRWAVKTWMQDCQNPSPTENSLALGHRWAPPDFTQRAKVPAASPLCLPLGSQCPLSPNGGPGGVSIFPQCSEACGGGEQERLVTCPEFGRCEETMRPNTTRPCNTHPCTKWVVGPWGQVSWKGWVWPRGSPRTFKNEP